ncbi:MAG: hypothetical protein K9K88_06955 [Desulfobacterales bacterium]|nr:hypothetical protein [Desulfobacterales bacterium]
MTDYDSPLAEEVLTDVAQTFFGARRKLDDMIEILKDYAQTLEQKAAIVIRRAGTLNYLLVEKDRIAAFYEAIGVSDPGELPRCEPPDPLPHLKPGFSLTGRGRFVKTVARQYERLWKACREYRCSSANPLADAKRVEDVCVDLKLVKAMWEIVNSKIREINEESSPSAVLQYAKGFDSRGEKQSKVAGATAGEYAGMDRKFVYRPIPIEEMHLHDFPELPEPYGCRNRIARFAKKIYPAVRGRAGERVARLARQGQK